MRETLESLGIGDGVLLSTECCGKDAELVFTGTVQRPSGNIWMFAEAGDTFLWEITERTDFFQAKVKPDAEMFFRVHAEEGGRTSEQHKIAVLTETNPASFTGWDDLNETFN